jgi:hypothetical protein
LLSAPLHGTRQRKKFFLKNSLPSAPLQSTRQRIFF